MANTKRKKQRTMKSLKAELDRVFSIFIRQRGMDEGGTNSCVSCGALKHWKELQCGHFVSRVYLSTRWNPINAHPQCGACNVLRRGNFVGYSRFMVNKFGGNIFEQLILLRDTPFNRSRFWYEQEIERFNAKVKAGWFIAFGGASRAKYDNL